MTLLKKCSYEEFKEICKLTCPICKKKIGYHNMEDWLICNGLLY